MKSYPDPRICLYCTVKLAHNWILGPAGNPKLLVIKSSQDMKKCSPHGRDCIENKSTSTFDCSVACEGIYADVQWVENVEDKKLVENDVEKKLSASNDEDLLRDALPNQIVCFFEHCSNGL